MSRDASGKLADAYEACRAVTAARARSFYLGLRLAPEPERSALYALYAWNRRGDDIVDAEGSSSAERAARLDDFERCTRDAFEGSPTQGDPLWIAFADLVRQYPIERPWLESMIAGLRADLDPVPPSDLAELDRYCSRVAGSVGRCCVAIWGTQNSADDHASDLADELGRAFQLTNILRDIGEDARLTPPRRYVPDSLLGSHGLDEAALLEWASPQACRGLVMSLVGEARRSFRAGDALAPLIRPRFRPTLWAMHRMYERTLDLIEGDPRRAVRARHVRPGKAVTLAIACRAFAMSALASGER